MWIRDWDKMRFDSEEEAFGNACMDMLTDGAIGDYFHNYVNYDKLLAWAMTQDGFFETFDDEFYKAQRDYFEDCYVELEDKDTDKQLWCDE